MAAEALGLLQTWVADMSYWLILISILLIGGSFTYSLLTASRAAEQEREK